MTKIQIKGKNSENSYQELKRSQNNRHTQTHGNCIEIFWLAGPSFSIEVWQKIGTERETLTKKMMRSPDKRHTQMHGSLIEVFWESQISFFNNIFILLMAHGDRIVAVIAESAINHMASMLSSLDPTLPHSKSSYITEHTQWCNKLQERSNFQTITLSWHLDFIKTTSQGRNILITDLPHRQCFSKNESSTRE